MAPAGTPKAVIDRLNGEITKAVNRPETRKNWLEQGAIPMSMSPGEFERYLDADIAKWAKVVKISGAKPDQ
jgi:tripartite-type tricarboxylate transporter receptor subunit TctC